MFDSGAIQSNTLSYTINNLPRDNSTVYIRLWYKQSGWEWVDFELQSGVLRIPLQGEFVWGIDQWGVAV